MPLPHRISATLKPHLWRILLLILFAIVAATGWYSYRIQQVSIELGYPNPTAKKFLVFRRDMHHHTKQTLVVNDRGKILNRVDIRNWNSQPRWTPDGNLVGVASFHKSDTAGRTLVRVELEPESTVTPLTHGIPGVSDAFCTESGNIIHVETPGVKNVNRANIARFVRNQQELIDEIEYRDEDLLNIYTHPTYDGSNAFVVKQQLRAKQLLQRTAAWGRPNASPPPKDATPPKPSPKPVFRSLDPTTGKYTELAKRDGFLAPGSSHHIVNFTEDFWTVFDTNTSRVILNLPNDTGTLPMVVGKNKFILLHDDGNFIDVFTVNNAQPKRIDAGGKVLNIKGYDDNTVLVATEEATVEKVNLTTGERQTVFHARPWRKSCRVMALCGLPIFVFLWLCLANRNRQLSPMAELVFVTLLSIASLLSWMRNAVTEAATINLVTLLLSGAALTFIAAWATNVRALLGRGVPAFVFGIAVTFRLITWRQSDGADVHTTAQQLNAAGLLIGFLTVGMLLLRRFGRRNEFVEIADYQIKDKQLALGQIVFLTCGFAVYFGVVRATGLSFNSKISVASMYFPAMYGVVVLTACYLSSFRERYWRHVGLFVFLCAAVATVALYERNATYQWSNVFQEYTYNNTVFQRWREFANNRAKASSVVLHPHLHPIYVGIMLFAALEYCRTYCDLSANRTQDLFNRE